MNQNTTKKDIVECLTKEKDAITELEIKKLAQLKESKGLLHSDKEIKTFTDYFYELINKAKTVKDISNLMEIVDPLEGFCNKFWTDIFEQVEENIDNGKNIIEAARFKLKDRYPEKGLVKFYENLIKCRKDLKKEFPPELYTKILETLEKWLEEIKDDYYNIENHISSVDGFLKKYIPSNNSLKKAFKNLIDTIYFIEKHHTDKKYEERLKDLETRRVRKD